MGRPLSAWMLAIAASVRAALVDGDLLGHTVQIHGALEERPGCGVVSLGAQQEVDRVAVAVDRPV